MILISALRAGASAASAQAGESRKAALAANDEQTAIETAKPAEARPRSTWKPKRNRKEADHREKPHHLRKAQDSKTAKQTHDSRWGRR